MKNAPAKKYIAALEKRHKEIRKYLAAENVNEALLVIEECQNCAIQFGTMIDKRIGEGTEAVKCLENYCEMLYQIYGELQQEKKKENEDIAEVFDDQLLAISDCIDSEMDIRIEAVFLPMQANTWGALESVWKAAAEDPDCEAYVIPIPYYDKHPDGSFGTMHDEASQFPSHIPITFYENYDFAGRRPDMIFIQNPYDEQGYTSSVDPFFYSKNLKQYTEKLVYIPWFLIDEIDGEDELGMQSIRSVATAPGVMYADKVIVQSEQMRQTYIEILVSLKGEDTRSTWEEKIVGIGSPLYDQEAVVQNREVAVPVEWNHMLYKSDGSRKKVILYGTSISMILQHKKKMLNKIASVLETLRKSSGELLTIWKPEDAAWTDKILTVADKQLAKSYQELVEQYQKEGWGIYDASPDLERAVSIADAFYGDSCRAIQMCRKEGLPVMVQDIDII